MVNFILVVSALVVFHELGHFLAARYFGVSVESFAIGFGPRLLGFERGGTDYKVCLLPLGGYVKMAGQNALGDTVGEPGDLPSKPRWQRLIIIGMGPAFNLVLALGLLAGLYMVRYERARFMDSEARVAYVSPGSPAAAAGVLPGDIVRSVDAVPSPTWQDLFAAAALATGRAVDLEVERAGKARKLQIEIAGDRSMRELADPGWSAGHAALLSRVLPSSPAEAAGLQSGDLLARMDGVEIVAVQQVIDRVLASEGRSIAIEVERAGERHLIEARPEADDDGAAWRLGMHLRPRYDMIDEPLPLGQALGRSAVDTVAFASLIFRTVGALVVGDVSVTALEGPVGIYQHTQDAAARGAGGLLQLMAVISVNLAILNLMPIPVLDGGQILMLLVESMLRRDVSDRVKGWVTQAGLAFILILFGIVMYNDLARQFFPP